MKTKVTKKEATKQVLTIDNISDLIKYCKTIGLEYWRNIFSKTFKYCHNHLNDLELQYYRIQGRRYQAQKTNDKLLIYSQIHKNIRELKHNYTNYSKVLTIGNTNIYMCHPYYGHRDYNKYILCSKSLINSDIIAKAQAIEQKIINS